MKAFDIRNFTIRSETHKFKKSSWFFLFYIVEKFLERNTKKSSWNKSSCLCQNIFGKANTTIFVIPLLRTCPTCSANSGYNCSFGSLLYQWKLSSKIIDITSFLFFFVSVEHQKLVNSEKIIASHEQCSRLSIQESVTLPNAAATPWTLILEYLNVNRKN